MPKAPKEALFNDFGLGERKPPEFFRSIDDVVAAPLNGYSHSLRRVWQRFDDLVGVLSIRGRPTVFFEQSSDERHISAANQRRFWSNGIASILVRATPSQVHVYSGLRSPARQDDEVTDNKRLITVFEGAARALEMREFLRSVELETVYDHYREHFDPVQAVDQQLVLNLAAARKQMSTGAGAPGLPCIHRILGRVLFTCYLEARRALVEKDFGGKGAGAKASFRDLLSLPTATARTAIEKLFRLLGRYFRGNLFDASLLEDLNNLRDADIQTLGNLIRGDELSSGQMVLPFDIYDFSVIPIETISAVYEDFIRAEDPDKQRSTGAYYTPPKLVEFTADLATETMPDLLDKRVLDPGCGSGVFLVSMFNRMAEAWARRHETARNGTRARELGKILTEQICGVDINPIACHATCFSLYMAMLDFLSPREIRQLGPERLPKLLLSEDQTRGANGPQTVIHGDFLASLPALESQSFDLIIGNPPWVARRRIEKDSLELWKSTHPSSTYPIPANQVACAFMWEASRYLKPDGRSCLLLPAGVLLGDQTDSFQMKWFAAHGVEKIAHLADLRFFLFPGADHPTIIVRFKARSPDLNQRIEFIAPKASYASMLDNLVVVEPDDRRMIRLDEMLSDAEKDVAAQYWLGLTWTSPRDSDLLRRLRALPALRELVGEPREGKRWCKGQGFKPERRGDKNPKRPFWPKGHPFLDARRSFCLLLGKADTRPVDSKITSLHRAPDQRIFMAPMVVFNQGFSNVAFSGFDVVFRHALQSISGPEHDRTRLMLLAATLMSPLAEYWAFHATSKSVYRGRPLLNEILSFPFPLPEYAPGSDPDEALRAVADLFARVRVDSRFESLGHDQLVAEGKREMAKHVNAYFDISDDEAMLIEDTISTLRRSATPSRGSSPATLAAPTVNDRRRYAETLINTLRAWSGGTSKYISARSVISEVCGLVVMTVRRDASKSEYTETKSTADVDRALSHLASLSPERYRSLVYLRNIAVMERDRMHIVKPLTMRFWLRSAALNDADAAAAHLIGQQRGRVVA